jgi:hypothetical protein
LSHRTFASVWFNHPSLTAKSGWDANRGLQLARAVWKFERDRLDVIITYRNLTDETDWPLGTVPRHVSDDRLTELFADQWESHTPGDWIMIDKKILALTIDRGAA